MAIAYRVLRRRLVALIGAAALTVPAVACEEAVAVHCGRTPSLAADADGLAVVFVSGDRIWFSRGDPDGAQFSAPVPVHAAPEPIDHNGESRPKVALGPDRSIHVTWTRRLPEAFAGEVRYARSQDGGRTFSAPVSLQDLEVPVSHRFDALHVAPSGAVHVVWIDKRPVDGAADSAAGASLFHAYSTDGGERFTANRRIAGPTCECCRLAVAPAEGEGFVVLWRHVFEGGLRDHALAVVEGGTARVERASFDGWELAGCPHEGPHVARGHGGHHLAWFTGAPGAGGLHYAFRHADTGSISRHARMTNRPGADKPQLCVAGEDLHYVWRAIVPGGFALQAVFSDDGGRTWQAPRELARTQSTADHPQCVAGAAGPRLAWHTAAEGLRVLPLEGR